MTVPAIHNLATASLIYPGYLEVGAEADVAARVAEYGTGFDMWPSLDWDYMRRLPVPQIDGTVVIFEHQRV